MVAASFCTSPSLNPCNGGNLLCNELTGNLSPHCADYPAWSHQPQRVVPAASMGQEDQGIRHGKLGFSFEASHVTLRWDGGRRGAPDGRPPAQAEVNVPAFRRTE